jgi:hypothetical protein
MLVCVCVRRRLSHLKSIFMIKVDEVYNMEVQPAELEMRMEENEPTHLE